MLISHYSTTILTVKLSCDWLKNEKEVEISVAWSDCTDRKKADVISLTFGEIYIYSVFNFAVKSTNMYVEMTCEARISYKSIFEK